MHIALVLHIYQPPTQYRDMLVRVTQESYERILALLEDHPSVRLTMNINASLTEQLDRMGFSALLERFKELVSEGRVELIGSAAYHPILPDLPKKEIIRQIKLNTRINQSFFGSAYRPAGFFPPELAYEDVVGEALDELGFHWTLVDGSAIADWQKYLGFVYQRRASRLLIFPREDSLSSRIAFGKIRTVLGMIRAIGARELAKRQYVVLAMDGETFGHHQPKQLSFLRELFRASASDRRIRLVTVSQIPRLYGRRVPADLFSSTWGLTEEVEGRRVWVRWRNPANPLHQSLDRLRSLAISAVSAQDRVARELLDQALASDTWWWASGKPFWHPGMVKRGAELFCKAILGSRNASVRQRTQARYLCYQAIPSQFRDLRSKRRRQQILENQDLRP